MKYTIIPLIGESTRKTHLQSFVTALYCEWVSEDILHYFFDILQIFQRNFMISFSMLCFLFVSISSWFKERMKEEVVSKVLSLTFLRFDNLCTVTNKSLRLLIVKYLG